MKIIKFIKQNREILAILVLSVLVSIFLLLNEYFVNRFFSENLTGILFSVFGILMGTLITAYTILLAFKNQVSKNVRETRAYKQVNLFFLLTLVSLWILIFTALLSYFVSNLYILFSEILLFSFSFFMFLYLIIIIYQLINLTN